MFYPQELQTDPGTLVGLRKHQSISGCWDDHLNNATIQKYTSLKYFLEYFGCFKVFVRRICQSISAAGENRLKNWCSFSNPTQITGFANLKAFPCILTIATGQFCFDQEQSRESEAQGFGSQAAGQEYHLIEERVCQWLRG